MGFADFLASQNLAPAVSARVQTIYDTPTGAEPAPVSGDAPLPDEMRRYGATPADIAIAQRANAQPVGQSPASPMLNPAFMAERGVDPVAKRGYGPGRLTSTDLEDAPAPEAPAGPTGPSGSPLAPQEPPASPGRYVPGGWQHATRAESRQQGMDPEKLAEGRYYRDVGQGHGLIGAEKHLEAAQMQGEADAVYSAAHARASEQALREAQRIENERKQYIAKEHDKLASLSAEASKQIDPEIARGPVGAQIFSALAIGMGQFGASMNGGTNAALQIVNANIDRNIAAQEKNIANAGKAHEREQNLYHQNLEAFGDRDRAVLATKMQMLDQAKAVADQAYAKSKSTMNEADYQATLQGLSDKHAEYSDQFAKATDDKVTTESHDAYKPGGMVGGGPSKDLPNVVTVNGTHYQMPNEKEHGKAVEKIQVIGKLQDMNNQALVARGKLEHLNALTDREAYLTEMGTLERLEEKKASLMSTDAGQGVLRDSEYARSVGREGFFTKGVGLTSDLTPGSGATRRAANTNIRRQIAEGDKDMKRFVEAAGGRIVKQGYARDASGNLAPVGAYTGQDTHLPEALPPPGFKPMRPGIEIPTAEAPAEETTPMAPRFGTVQGSAAGTAKGGKAEHMRHRK